MIRGKEFRDGGHIDAVETRSEDGWARDAEVNFASFPSGLYLLCEDVEGGGSDDRVFDEEDAFSSHDFGYGSVFASGAVLAGATFDESPSDVPVSEESFGAGQSQFVSEGVGGRFGGVGNGYDDTVLGVDGLGFDFRQGYTKVCPGNIYAVAIYGAAGVCEVDPLEETTGGLLGRREAFDSHFSFVDQDHSAGLDGFYIGKAGISQSDAFGSGGKEVALNGVAKWPEAQGIPGYNELAQSIEKNDVVRTVESLSQAGEDFQHVRGVVAAE